MDRESDFETVMGKSELLGELMSRLDALRASRLAAYGGYQKAHKAHVRKVASVLAQASKEIAAGKLKPGRNGRWCDVRAKIESRIGEAPDDLSELDREIANYEAAIRQVKYNRGDPMRVTTTQVRVWLSGGTVRKGRWQP